MKGLGSDASALIRRHPLFSYFGVVFGASGAALVVIGPPSVQAVPERALAPLIVFPLMVITVGAAGLSLTAATDGRQGVSRVLRSARRWQVPLPLYSALLLPPACILVSLALLQSLEGPAFHPNLFPIGFAFGVIAGFFEEFGWTGFAYPRVKRLVGVLPGAVALGLVWALWHIPVVDSLGVASPHGNALPWFFVAFAVVLIGLRILIATLFELSGSLLLAHSIHASSTGFLVALGPTEVTATQEATWYGLYGVLLTSSALAIAFASSSRHASVMKDEAGDD
jgi:membrane protease YdiL (CAAX protease family)